MNWIVVCLMLIAATGKAFSQELYMFTEPASNMPAKSVGAKVTARFPRTGYFSNRYITEFMIGIDKHWMVHISSTFSDFYSDKLRLESGRIYAKYRFYSNDDVHRHFRMAAFGDASITKSPYRYNEPNLEGDNSGLQGGLIATQLVNRLAISSTVAYSHFFSVSNNKLFTLSPSYNAVNYSLSAGYLIFPKDYKNYSQTNMNAYLELLGYKSLDQQHYYIDLAPAIQFIFNSNSKINIGYRFQFSGNMYRMANSQVQIGFEHTFFNVWR